MFKNSKTIVPYEDIDYEIRILCLLMNKIPGIETVESCFGHGKHPCWIWFKVDSIDTFSKFLFHFFNGEQNWFIIADCADPHRDADYLMFRLQSGNMSDEYFVRLMVDKLEERFIDRLEGCAYDSDSDEFWKSIWR